MLSMAIYLFLEGATQQPAAHTLLAGQKSELPCYPNTFAKARIINQFTFKGSTYYEVYAPPKNDPNSTYLSILYFRTSIKGCELLNPNTVIGSRLLYMPEPVALHFARLRFQTLLDQCLQERVGQINAREHCRRKLESLINVPGDVKAEGIEFLYPEDVEALRQMGIKANQVFVIKTEKDLQELWLKKIRRNKKP